MLPTTTCVRALCAHMSRLGLVFAHNSVGRGTKLMPPLAPIVGSLAAAELLSCVFVLLIELESFL